MGTTADPEPDDLAELVQRAVQGDINAFTELHARLTPRLHVWARHKLTRHLQRVCEPEDLMQETWQRAHLGMARYDSKLGRFESWFFGVAKNVLLGSLRRAGRAAAIQINEGHTTRVQKLAEAEDPITSLTKRISRDDDHRKLAELIADLPADEQELIVLCGLERATCVEAAASLGANPEAVTKRWQRLRERLRNNPLFAQLVDG